MCSLPSASSYFLSEFTYHAKPCFVSRWFIEPAYSWLAFHDTLSHNTCCTNAEPPNQQVTLCLSLLYNEGHRWGNILGSNQRSLTRFPLKSLKQVLSWLDRNWCQGKVGAIDRSLVEDRGREGRSVFDSTSPRSTCDLEHIYGRKTLFAEFHNGDCAEKQRSRKRKLNNTLYSGKCLMKTTVWKLWSTVSVSHNFLV